MCPQRNHAAVVVRHHVRPGHAPVIEQVGKKFALDVQGNPVVAVLGRATVPRHVPQVALELAGEGARERLPQRRRPWRAVAEHHGRPATEPCPAHRASLPGELLAQLHPGQYANRQPEISAGAMLWLLSNRLVGSYRRFTCTRRSHVALGYASRTRSGPSSPRKPVYTPGATRPKAAATLATQSSW